MHIQLMPVVRAPQSRAAAALALSAAMAVGLAVPAFAQDDAEIAFPTTLAGEELEIGSFSGSEYLAQFEGGEATDTTFVEGAQALVEGVGATIDDLTVKSGLYQPAEGPPTIVLAFRVAGAEGRDFAEDAIQLLLGDIVLPDLLLRPVAGKWVLRVTDATMPGVYPRTAFVDGDTVWIVEGDEPFVWEALDQIPDATTAGEASATPLVNQVPVELDGERRTGLYEATEPLFLPTLSERLQEPLEDWLLDLFLEGGLSPAEMIGLVTWWGIESSQESIQIEGYQIPGAGADLVERLRSQVILADGTELPEGVTREDGEMGGKQVATVDFGSTADGGTGVRQHVFSTDDTVWVVTDHAGETELAEEAVAALP